MTQIISFIGLNGSGKSTTARKLKTILEAEGKTAEIISLATPLKEIAARNCGYDEEKKRDGHREILLKLGKDIRTYLGDEVFCYACLDKISKMSADYVIIDDMRWYIEAEILSSFITMHVIEISSTGLVSLDEINLSEEYQTLETLKRELADNEFIIYAIPNYMQCGSELHLLEILKSRLVW